MQRARHPAELEIKLRLPRHAIASLLRHPALVARKAGRLRRRKLVSTYFDTANLRLAKEGAGLRIRRDGRRWIQTIKGPPDPSSGGGLAARPEYEWALGASARMPALDTMRLATTPWRKMLLKAARTGLAPIFATEFMRTEIPVALPARTRAIVAVDVGAIRAIDSKRRSDLCEVEIELESGSVEQLFRFAGALAEALPFALEPSSKAARGLALVARTLPRPQRAVDATLAHDAPAGHALASIIRGCLRQIEGNADGLLRDDDDVEWVHQMRIGTRRLRACLSLLSHLVTSTPLARLTDDVKWLARALGAARDLDVLAQETLPAIRRGAQGSGDVAAARALRSLGAKVARQRSLARRDARKAVASARFVQMVLAAGALAATPEFGSAGDAAVTAALAAPAREFAARVLARRQKKLLRRGESLPDAPPPARHAARIAAKKLRYATEFFADLFPEKRARTYRKSLTRLQDVLGAMNDAVVAVRLSRETAGADSTVSALLQGWAAAQTTTAGGDLARAWREFTHSKTFWD